MHVLALYMCALCVISRMMQSDGEEVGGNVPPSAGAAANNGSPGPSGVRRSPRLSSPAQAACPSIAGPRRSPPELKLESTGPSL